MDYILSCTVLNTGFYKDNYNVVINHDKTESSNVWFMMFKVYKLMF
ncbi:hypothetical protein [Candidatus Hodgkinia cicadicola]